MPTYTSTEMRDGRQYVVHFDAPDQAAAEAHCDAEGLTYDGKLIGEFDVPEQLALLLDYAHALDTRRLN